MVGYERCLLELHSHGHVEEEFLELSSNDRGIPSSIWSIELTSALQSPVIGRHYVRHQMSVNK